MFQKKQISSCQRKRSRLMEKVVGNLDMVQGSVVEKYIRCGRGNCRCQEGKGHGPFYYLSFRENGKTKLIYIPEDEVPRVVEQVEQFKRFKQAGSQISKLNREILRLRLAKRGMGDARKKRF